MLGFFRLISHLMVSTSQQQEPGSHFLKMMAWMSQWWCYESWSPDNHNHDQVSGRNHWCSLVMQQVKFSYYLIDQKFLTTRGESIILGTIIKKNCVKVQISRSTDKLKEKAKALTENSKNLDNVIHDHLHRCFQLSIMTQNWNRKLYMCDSSS